MQEQNTYIFRIPEKYRFQECSVAPYERRHPVPVLSLVAHHFRQLGVLVLYPLSSSWTQHGVCLYLSRLFSEKVKVIVFICG